MAPTRVAPHRPTANKRATIVSAGPAARLRAGAKAKKRKPNRGNQSGQHHTQSSEGSRKPHRKGGNGPGPKPSKRATKRGGSKRGPKQGGPKAGGGRPPQKRSGGRPGQGKGSQGGRGNQGGQRRRGQGRTS